MVSCTSGVAGALALWEEARRVLRMSRQQLAFQATVTLRHRTGTW